MFTIATHRPRNVNAARAAAILYGDWGTSKAYVIGLAFALAGYGSFWLILGVSLLSLLVGLNYMLICKHYPYGGGVYASVRGRSALFAAIGAFFLIADYTVTISLSALSAFNYLGVTNPLFYSVIFILLIGLLNYFGPRHTGTFALIIAIVAVSMLTGLALLSLPFLKQGWAHVQALPKNPLSLWPEFCTVIIALSGIETVANATSVMRLNPNTTESTAQVTKTSTPAILTVMLEVVIYTTLFGLAASAIDHFQFENHTVSAPGTNNVEDRMLSYLALIFGTKLLGTGFATVFSKFFALVICLLLLSAVNTAIHGLISLQYVMASDEELPKSFRKVNSFGVPLVPLTIATIIPALLLVSFKKVVYLADLYAIGFVGAIMTNLGATSQNFRIPLKTAERLFMFLTFLIMAAIEVTLFIEKPEARYFALSMIGIGFGLRGLTRFMKKRKELAETLALAKPLLEKEAPLLPSAPARILCVVRKEGTTLIHALSESHHTGTPLSVVFIREQKVIAERDFKRRIEHDLIAQQVLAYIQEHSQPEQVHFQYCVSDSFVDITAAYALRLEASEVIIDPAPLLWARRRERQRLRALLPHGVAVKIF